MTAGEDDVDFKPFFDLVVGVIFILLILVAAQLFITRWDADSQPSPPSPDIRREVFEAERKAYLDTLAASTRLVSPGTRVNHATQTLSIPIAPLRAAGAVGREANAPFVFDSARIAELAHILADQLGCVTPASGPACPALRMLRLLRSEGHALSGPAGGSSASARARLLGVMISAALLGARPHLLDLRTQGGEPVFPMIFMAQPVETDDDAGQIDIRLIFMDPAALPMPAATPFPTPTPEQK